MTVNESQSGVSRRGFLEAFAATSVGAAVGGAAIVKTAAAAAATRPIEGKRMGKKGILYESTVCVGCRYCEMVCKNNHSLSCDVELDLQALPQSVIPESLRPKKLFNGKRPDTVTVDDRTADRWLRVTSKDVVAGGVETTLWMRHACTHCGLCAEVCPSGAIRMTEDGAVDVDPERCIGCKYCYQACPFDIPRYRDRKVYGDAGMQKCTMCADRLKGWEVPACAGSCPVHALTFGIYEDLVEKGRARVAQLKAQGFEKAVLYGERELGGLGVMYVLPYARKNYGLPYLPQE